MPKLDFRSPRLFVDTALAAGVTVALERNQSNYLGNVLRLSAGETILVFNGRDGEWQASIAGSKRPDSLKLVARTRPTSVNTGRGSWRGLLRRMARAAASRPT